MDDLLFYSHTSNKPTTAMISQWHYGQVIISNNK